MSRTLSGSGAREERRAKTPRELYLRAMANWAFDMLVHRPRAVWPPADPASDFRDRDWRRLYRGSVLDD